MSNSNVGNEMVFIYTVMPNQDAAAKIGAILIENRLAACVNSFPINSAYIWNNEMTLDDEIVVLIKSIESKFKEIEQEILANHPYEVPIIAKWKVSVNASYFEWLNSHIS